MDKSQETTSRFRKLPFLFVLSAPLLSGGFAVGADASAEVLLKAAGSAAGLCVHIRSDETGPCLELARTGRWVVHTLCGTEAATTGARSAFAENRLYGLASAEHRPRLESLPYADRLANLLLIDHWKDAAQRGLTWAECLRIVMPRGVILAGGASAEEIAAQIAPHRERIQELSRDGGLIRITTAWPPDIGQWTHAFLRDAGNQKIATDPINPARQNLWFQWIDAPPRGAGWHGVWGAGVSAGGRLIALADYEAGALYRDGKAWGVARPLTYQMYVLSCRDAFNGAVQWLRPWDGRNVRKAKRSLAFAGGRIFTVEAGRLTATDIRDGSILYAAEAPAKFDAASWLHCDENVVAVHDLVGTTDADGVTTGLRSLSVFAAASGRLLWQSPNSIVRAALEGGRLFTALARSQDMRADSEELRAFDAAGGAPLWKKTAEDLGGKEGDKITLHAASMGLVLVSLGDSGTILLKGDSGEIAYRFQVHGDPLFIADRLVVGKDPSSWFDLKTGALLGQAARPGRYAAMGMWACAAGAHTQRQFLDAFDERETPPKARKDLVRQYPHMGTARLHITCSTGDVVAHGLVYQPEQGCKCGHPYRGGRVYGLYAVAPVEAAPPRKAFEEPGPLEKGPAFGQGDPGAAGNAAAGDWPMFRADPERSCAGAGSLPAQLEVLWRKPLAVRPDAWIAHSSWRAQHNHNQAISAPVVAGGKVFVSLVDEHQVVALDAGRGEVLWRFTANARLDSPPTFHKGLCLFGCRDGWVYCLDAATGRLAWRRCITPLDQRILVYGQLESRWPAIGSVLVNGDRAYATAGHDAGLGILLWEFDPLTGATLAYRATPPSTFPNDILVRGEEGGIWLNKTGLTPLAKVAAQPAAAAGLAKLLKKSLPVLPDHLMPVDTPILGTAGTLWMGRMRLGEQFRRQIWADRWVWNGEYLIGFKGDGYKGGASPHPGWDYAGVQSGGVFCIAPAKLAGEAGKALLWHTPSQDDVWAMALTDTRLLVAGPRLDRPKPPEPAAQSQPVQRPKTPQEMIAAIKDASARSSEPVVKPVERKHKTIPVGKPAESLWDLALLSEIEAAWKIHHQDPLAAPGYLRVLDLVSGQVLHELALPVSLVQDGLAISGGRVFATLTDGSVACLGKHGE